MSSRAPTHATDRQLFLGAPANPDHLHPFFEIPPAFPVVIPTRIRLSERLAIEIDGREPRGGRSPGDALVVARPNHGNPRHGRPGDIEFGAAHVCDVQQRRRRGLQVGVRGEDRIATLGMLTSQHPRAASHGPTVHAEHPPQALEPNRGRGCGSVERLAARQHALERTP